jgi:hypothetical protein
MATPDSNKGREQLRPFTPSFPLFLVHSGGAPVIGNDGATRFVMACATFELAELVVSQFRESDSESDIDFSRITDPEMFAEVARELIDQDVTHMSWNATRRSTTINVVDLADFASV